MKKQEEGKKETDVGVRVIDEEQQLLESYLAKDEAPVRLETKPGRPIFYGPDFHELEEAQPVEAIPQGEAVPEDSRVPVGWYLLTGFLALAFMLWGGWRILYLGNEQILDVEPALSTDLAKESSEQRVAQTAEDHTSAINYYDELSKRVEKYFAAKNVEDLRGLIRHEERVMPLIRKYYEDRPLEIRVFKGIEMFSSIQLEKIPMIGMQVSFEDGPSASILAQDSEEGPLIDWESSVSYQPQDPMLYLEERSPEPAVFRVYAQLDNFFAYEYSEEDRYYSIRLTFRNSPAVLAGYVERNNALGRELLERIEVGGGTPMPMTLRVRFQEGRAPKSVLIEDVIAHSWMIGL